METNQVKWPNVIGFALLIFAVWMLLHMHKEVVSLLKALGELSPGHPRDQRIFGLIVFSIIMVVIVGVFNVLLHSKK